MAAHSEEQKELLLRTDDEFRELAIRHSELEDRLIALAAKHYLSELEQLEESTLKKRKLAIKDQMEGILRRTRHQDAAALSPSAAQSVR